MQLDFTGAKSEVPAVGCSSVLASLSLDNFPNFVYEVMNDGYVQPRRLSLLKGCTIRPFMSLPTSTNRVIKSPARITQRQKLETKWEIGYTRVHPILHLLR